FASNDERTARRISDSLGTATELRAMKNYAGHRLAPWLSHLMVSRQETARPLLTPGEVMQLPQSDALVLVSGLPPIRAQKVRDYEEPALQARVLTPPLLADGVYRDRPPAQPDDWTGRVTIARVARCGVADEACGAAEGGIRRQPELPEHEDVAPELD